MTPTEDRPLSALPSTLARVLAFASILAGGLVGGIIGWGFATIGCDRGCTNRGGLGIVTGAALGAAGIAVVAVLALRAMGEWRRIQHERDSTAGGQTD